MRRSRVSVSLAVSLICLPAAFLRAADEPIGFEQTPFASYRFGGTFEVSGDILYQRT